VTTESDTTDSTSTAVELYSNSIADEKIIGVRSHNIDSLSAVLATAQSARAFSNATGNSRAVLPALFVDLPSSLIQRCRRWNNGGGSTKRADQREGERHSYQGIMKLASTNHTPQLPTFDLRNFTSRSGEYALALVVEGGTRRFFCRRVCGSTVNTH
jgi:hypothetical protein